MPQLLRRLLALGDVVDEADVAGEVAVHVLERPPRLQQPPPGAVLSLHPELALERLPGIERLAEDPGVLVPVPLVHPGQPAVPRLVRHVPAGELQPVAVEVVALAVRAGVPDQPREALEQREIEVPGALQGRLRPLAIGDVPERGDDAGDFAVAVPERAGVDLHSDPGPGLDFDVELPLYRLTAVQDVLDQLSEFHPGLQAHEQAHGPIFAFPRGKAGDLVGPGVGVRHLAFRIEGDDAIV